MEKEFQDASLHTLDDGIGLGIKCPCASTSQECITSRQMLYVGCAISIVSFTTEIGSSIRSPKSTKTGNQSPRGVSKPILPLKLIPRLIQRTEHSPTDHPLLRRRGRR